MVCGALVLRGLCTNDAHVRVDVLENEKISPTARRIQQDAGRALRRSEEEMEQCVHLSRLQPSRKENASRLKLAYLAASIAITMPLSSCFTTWQ